MGFLLGRTRRHLGWRIGRDLINPTEVKLQGQDQVTGAWFVGPADSEHKVGLGKAEGKKG